MQGSCSSSRDLRRTALLQVYPMSPAAETCGAPRIPASLALQLPEVAAVL